METQFKRLARISSIAVHHGIHECFRNDQSRFNNVPLLVALFCHGCHNGSSMVLPLRLMHTWVNAWSKRRLNSLLNRLRSLHGSNEQIVASADRYQSLVDLFLKQICCGVVLFHGH